MPAYVAYADVSGLTVSQQKSAAKRILKLIERHEGFKKRTGKLSRSAYVTLRQNITLEAGANASYASFLNLGTKNIDGSVRIKGIPYIEKAVSKVLGKSSIIYTGMKLPI